MELAKKIEAILFFKNEPVSQKRLSEILKVSGEEIAQALEILKNSLLGRGMVLMEREGEVMLGTSPEVASIIEELQKEELNKDLSKASLETLSIVLYKNGASRADIDYIRGVNSSFTLRALAIRGLVEKAADPKDNRRFIYKPSFELLSYMGVRSVQELPDFEEVNRSIESSAEVKEEENI
jgi:segregation and condensation protein B